MEIIIGLIIAWVLLKVFQQDEPQIIIRSVSYPVATETRETINNISMEHTKREILKIFYSECNNKRELLVKKLRELEHYEDPGEFLEKYSFIQDYIFNHYLYDVG